MFSTIQIRKRFKITYMYQHLPLSSMSVQVRIDCSELITSPCIEALNEVGPVQTNSATMWKMSGKWLETKKTKYSQPKLVRERNFILRFKLSKDDDSSNLTMCSFYYQNLHKTVESSTFFSLENSTKFCILTFSNY